MSQNAKGVAFFESPSNNILKYKLIGNYCYSLYVGGHICPSEVWGGGQNGQNPHIYQQQRLY